MKWSKRFLTLILVVIFFAVGVGCSSKKIADLNYTALEVGTSEFPLWENYGYYQDESAPKEASVKFNGKTYSGVYDSSLMRVPRLYVTHRYEGDNFFFEIEDKTGKLSYIDFSYKSTDKSPVSKEKCRQIADSIADDYIDLSDYKVRENTEPDDYLSSFTYYREISGYETTDTLTVVVQGNGNISSFGRKMLGSFKDVKSVNIDKEKAKSVIEAKLKSIHQDKIDLNNYSIKSIILIRLDEDSVALYYVISFYYRIEMEGGYGISGEIVDFLLT